MREHAHPNGTTLVEFDNGSVAIYTPPKVYKTILSKGQLEALAVYLGAALPVEPGRYVDVDGDDWYLRPDGEWINPDRFVSDPTDYMPLTKAE